MTAEEYDAYIQRIVDRAPPPTPALKARLRILLAPAVEQIHHPQRDLKVAA